MRNQNIAKVLKEYRKRNHLSVNDVSILLEDRSFTAAPKTIYGWESGQANPSADILLTLCDLYNITDILEAFGYDSNENFHVTPSERTIIEAYRAHPEMHEAVSVLLGCSVPRKGPVSAHNSAVKEVSHPKQHSSGTNTTAAPKSFINPLAAKSSCAWLMRRSFFCFDLYLLNCFHHPCG